MPQTTSWCSLTRAWNGQFRSRISPAAGSGSYDRGELVEGAPIERVGDVERAKASLRLIPRQELHLLRGHRRRHAELLALGGLYSRLYELQFGLERT